MSEAPNEPDQPDVTESEGQISEGQVSEVQHLDPDETQTPISPEDSVAGAPEGESGEPDTAGSGPDSAPPENRRANEV
jgi:hypothetical protein